MTKNEKSTTDLPVAQLPASLAQFQAEVKAVVKTGLKSKTAMIRLLKPAFDHMNVAGFTQEQLVEVMNKAGLEMTLGQLKTILWREKSKG